MRVHRKGLRVAVNAVVHVQPVNMRGGKLIPGREASDLDRNLFVPKLLFEVERVKHDRRPAEYLLDGELVTDVFLRKATPVPVQAAHGEISPFPADQFFKVQSEFKTDVVAIGKAGAFSSDRISGDIA